MHILNKKGFYHNYDSLYSVLYDPSSDSVSKLINSWYGTCRAALTGTKVSDNTARGNTRTGNAY